MRIYLLVSDTNKQRPTLTGAREIGEYLIEHWFVKIEQPTMKIKYFIGNSPFSSERGIIIKFVV